MKIFKNVTFYFALLICFFVYMAINQKINEEKEYYAIIKVVFNNGTKKQLKFKGNPDVHLGKGDLSVGGNVECSNVNSFDWKVYKIKK